MNGPSRTKLNSLRDLSRLTFRPICPENEVGAPERREPKKSRPAAGTYSIRVIAGVFSCAWICTLLWGTYSEVPVACGVYSQAQSPQKAAADTMPGTVVVMTCEELLRYFPDELKNLKFSPNQDELDSLLQKVGERVDAFFRGFPDAASKESVLLERLKANGKVEVSIKQNYDYLVLVYPDQAGIRLEEDRNELKDRPSGHKGISGYCLTSGYVGTPVLFLPRRQAGSSYRYLGRQSSEPYSHVIAFAQKPEVENAIGSFRTDARSKSTPMLYQGLIWVDPQTYEIVRLRTDLLAPMPDINLTGHTTEVSFGEVHFNSISQVFWLPQKVTVTIRWKGKIFRNLHRYSDYRLFTVKSYDKIAQPQTKK